MMLAKGSRLRVLGNLWKRWFWANCVLVVALGLFVSSLVLAGWGWAIANEVDEGSNGVDVISSRFVVGNDVSVGGVLGIGVKGSSEGAVVDGLRAWEHVSSTGKVAGSFGSFASLSTVPGVVEGLFRVDDGIGWVRLGWLFPVVDGGIGVDGFEVRWRGLNSEVWAGEDMVKTSFGGSRTSFGGAWFYVVNGLEVGGAYEFQVRAFNAVGGGAWSSTRFVVGGEVTGGMSGFRMSPFRGGFRMPWGGIATTVVSSPPIASSQLATLPLVTSPPLEPGLMIAASNPTEGQQHQASVALAALPTGPLTVSVAVTGAAASKIRSLDTNLNMPGTQNILTFTPSNWFQPQIITYTTADDNVVNVPVQQTFNLTFTYNQGVYNTPHQKTTMLQIIDDDIAGTIATQPSGNAQVTENGGTDTSYNVLSDQTVTITDDDPLPPLPDDSLSLASADNLPPDNQLADTPVVVFADSPYTVSETSASPTVAAKVAVFPAPTSDITVGYTVRGTARSGNDYTALAGKITIPAGATSASIPVTIIDDAIGESTETILLVFTPHSSYAIGIQNANIIAIIDDDTSGLKIAETSGYTQVAENSGTDSYTVVLTSKPTADVTVTVTPNDTDAVLLEDTDSIIQGVQNRLTFTPTNWNTAQTVVVTGQDDDIDNPSNRRTTTIKHAVSSTDTSYNVLSDQTVTVTITDDDPLPPLPDDSSSLASADNQPPDNQLADTPVVVFADRPYTVSETSASPTVAAKVAVFPAPTSDITVGYTVRGTARSGNDYTALAGKITIPAGATSASIPVTIIDDAIGESTETILLVFTPHSSYAIGIQNANIIAIIDDDAELSTATLTTASNTVATP